MHIRYLKIMFAVLTSLLAIIYAAQNIANLGAAHQFFVYVMSGADHPAYPNAFGFETADPALAWVATAVDISPEFVAGILMAVGAVSMLKAARGRRRCWRICLARAFRRRRRGLLPDAAERNRRRLNERSVPVFRHLRAHDPVPQPARARTESPRG